MDIKNIISSCKGKVSQSSIDLYETKLRLLNDNRQIKNLKFLYDVEAIVKKVKATMKPNTQRSYLISISSFLNCYLQSPKCKDKRKLTEIYKKYKEVLFNYNETLKDQTGYTETEKANMITPKEIDEVYKELEKNKDKSKKDYINFLVLSFYYHIPPRRNADYLKMIYNINPNDNNNNYYDGSKFIFNIYKTAKTYDTQELEVPQVLREILDDYIKKFNLKSGDYLITTDNNNPYKNSNAITTILNKIFGKNVSSSMLRKVYLTSKYAGLNEALKDDTTKMGTSPSMANNNYIKRK